MHASITKLKISKTSEDCALPVLPGSSSTHNPGTRSRLYVNNTEKRCLSAPSSPVANREFRSTHKHASTVIANTAASKSRFCKREMSTSPTPPASSDKADLPHSQSFPLIMVHNCADSDLEEDVWEISTIHRSRSTENLPHTSAPSQPIQRSVSSERLLPKRKSQRKSLPISSRSATDFEQLLRDDNCLSVGPCSASNKPACSGANRGRATSLSPRHSWAARSPSPIPLQRKSAFFTLVKAWEGELEGKEQAERTHVHDDKNQGRAREKEKEQSMASYRIRRGFVKERRFIVEPLPDKPSVPQIVSDEETSQEVLGNPTSLKTRYNPRYSECELPSEQRKSIPKPQTLEPLKGDGTLPN